jgi:hypothetical protein
MASPRSTDINIATDDYSTFSSSATANGKEVGGETASRTASPSIEGDIEDLARHFSKTIGDELHAFKPQPGSQLDPNCPHFDAREWVKALVKLNESDPNSAPSRSLGVAFQNLSVHGWGTGGAAYQQGVLDMPVDAVKFVANLLLPNRRKEKIEILHNFEGVIEEGELLLVLGPPGAGCSTLLKTISGETAGLEVDDQSYMNFRGEHLSPPFSHLSWATTDNAQASTQNMSATGSEATSSTTPKSTPTSPISPSAKPYPSPPERHPSATSPKASRATRRTR